MKDRRTIRFENVPATPPAIHALKITSDAYCELLEFFPDGHFTRMPLVGPA